MWWPNYIFKHQTEEIGSNLEALIIMTSELKLKKQSIEISVENNMLNSILTFSKEMMLLYKWNLSFMFFL